MQTPKMLTIEQTAKAFNLPKNFIRQAVLDGRIVHVKAGKKHLVNAQKVEEWLNAGDSPTSQQVQAHDWMVGAWVWSLQLNFEIGF